MLEKLYSSYKICCLRQAWNNISTKQEEGKEVKEKNFEKKRRGDIFSWIQLPNERQKVPYVTLQANGKNDLSSTQGVNVICVCVCVEYVEYCILSKSTRSKDQKQD